MLGFGAGFGTLRSIGIEVAPADEEERDEKSEGDAPTQWADPSRRECTEPIGKGEEARYPEYGREKHDTRKSREGQTEKASCGIRREPRAGYKTSGEDGERKTLFKPYAKRNDEVVVNIACERMVRARKSPEEIKAEIAGKDANAKRNEGDRNRYDAVGRENAHDHHGRIFQDERTGNDSKQHKDGASRCVVDEMQNEMGHGAAPILADFLPCEMHRIRAA